MKGKKEIIILAAIIVAVVAYLVLRPTDRTTYSLPMLSEITKNEITRIEMISAEKSIVAHREGDNWFVGPKDFPADVEKIDQMLNTISKLTLTALVSESKNDQRYDLNPEKRIQVKASNGDGVLREFNVGKVADTFRHTFVKMAGDDKVFHAKDNFRERFEATVDQLRNKQVMAFKVDEIKSFKITKDKTTAEFKKKEAIKEVKKEDNPAQENAKKSEKSDVEWITQQGENADASKINTFLRTLADLQCKAYLDPSGDGSLENPVVTIALFGDKPYEISIYTALEKKQEEDALWPATSSENNYPFILAEWKAKDIMKDPAELMPDQPKTDSKP